MTDPRMKKMCFGCRAITIGIKKHERHCGLGHPIKMTSYLEYTPLALCEKPVTIKALMICLSEKKTKQQVAKR